MPWNESNRSAYRLLQKRNSPPDCDIFFAGIRGLSEEDIPSMEIDGFAELLDAGTLPEGASLDEALPVIYQELRGLANKFVRQERTGHTLQPTALTHEAYLRLRANPSLKWSSRAHLLALVGRAMRRTLVDYGRARRAQKRGGGNEVHGADVSPLLVVDLANESSSIDWSDLEDALVELGKRDARKLSVVEMLYFAGLTTSEAATVLGVAKRTVERDWNFARAWLLAHLKKPR